MFRKILVGTDGSDTARLAVAHAAHLAQALSAELTVASVYPTPGKSAAGGMSAVPDAVVARAVLRDAEAEHAGGARIATRALEGDPATGLLGLFTSEDFDLLVVGNRGLGSGIGPLQRSVPDQVSARAHRAVLIVDTMGGRPPSYERILVEAGPAGPGRLALEAAAMLAASGLGTITPYAAMAHQGSVTALVEGLGLQSDQVEAVVTERDPTVARLCELAESGGYDLVTVGQRRPAGARRLLGAPVSKVVRGAKTSVLIVQAD